MTILNALENLYLLYIILFLIETEGLFNCYTAAPWFDVCFVNKKKQQKREQNDNKTKKNTHKCNMQYENRLSGNIHVVHSGDVFFPRSTKMIIDIEPLFITSDFSLFEHIAQWYPNIILSHNKWGVKIKWIFVWSDFLIVFCVRIKCIQTMPIAIHFILSCFDLGTTHKKMHVKWKTKYTRLRFIDKKPRTILSRENAKSHIDIFPMHIFDWQSIYVQF